MKTVRLRLRQPEMSELTELSALCQRSKAHWGYDSAFIAACAQELTVTEDELRMDVFQLAVKDTEVLGMAQLHFSAAEVEMDRLYVDPNAIGMGVGQRLFAWAITEAKSRGAVRMKVVADPHAVGFYLHMGARIVGETPSGSIPGRMLPELSLDL